MKHEPVELSDLQCSRGAAATEAGRIPESDDDDNLIRFRKTHSSYDDVDGVARRHSEEDGLGEGIRKREFQRVGDIV